MPRFNIVYAVEPPYTLIVETAACSVQSLLLYWC